MFTPDVKVCFISGNAFFPSSLGGAEDVYYEILKYMCISSFDFGYVSIIHSDYFERRHVFF